MDGDGKRIVVYGLLTLIGLAVLYVLSIGPANALIVTTGYGMEAGEIIYAPVIWLHDHTPLEAPLEWYVELWSWR